MKPVNVGLAIVACIGGLLWFQTSDVRKRRLLEEDRRLVALLVAGGDRCKSLADGLLSAASTDVSSGLVGAFVSSYLAGEEVAAELAAEEASRAAVTQLLHARPSDRPGMETLVAMATSQERLCGLVRSTGSHSLLTLREAVVGHGEALAAAEARVGLEIPGVAPRLVTLSPEHATSIEEAARKARDVLAAEKRKASAAEAAKRREDNEAQAENERQRLAEEQAARKAELARSVRPAAVVRASDDPAAVLERRRRAEYVAAVSALRPSLSLKTDGKDVMVELSGVNSSGLTLVVSVALKPYLRLRNRNLPLVSSQRIVTIEPGPYGYGLRLEGLASHSPGVDVTLDPERQALWNYIRGR